MTQALPGRPLHVLVVDDSAVVRQVVVAILSAEPGLSVASAADPLIARQKIARGRPDVILLDQEMPRMDGLTFLRELMADPRPIPVVVLSGVARPGTEAAVRALEEGAVGIVAKPSIAVREFLEESRQALAGIVREASEARLLRRLHPLRKLTADAILPARSKPRAVAPSGAVIALGASTGGTEALRAILQGLPADAPPAVVVQHMPAGFTAAFARRLDDLCGVDVKEAAEGDELSRGLALIAPGDRHLLVERRGARLFARLSDGPAVSRHRPSVDVLFRSVAQSAGPLATGVILTGMGDDGAAGLAEMRAAGARTIAQDEASCVVFGMPKEAIARGAVERTLPLDRIAAAIVPG